MHRVCLAGVALVATLFFFGCRGSRHAVEQRERLESVTMESRTSGVVQSETSQKLSQRTVVWSVMERDTATGGLVETRRETLVETVTDTTSAKIENKAENTASAVVSSESDVTYQEETETSPKRPEMRFLFFSWLGLVAMLTAVVFLLRKKIKNYMP